MLKVRVRPAVAPERESLEALQRRASLNNPGDREAMLANPEAIQLPLQQIADGCVFVAEQQGNIKGFSVILPREDGDSELDGLFVEPACWRQGIGRALVEYSASAARSGGAKSLHVLGNAHAEGFYAACGFVTCGTERTQFGMALVMRRALR
jgi:GNAT superfamily N-acetyltransferase